MIKQLCIIALFAIGLFISASAFAEDYIEIKGRGIMSGKIVSENSKEVAFRDPQGVTQTFPRSEITMIEKGKPAEQSKLALFSAPSLPSFSQKKTQAASAPASSFAFKKSMTPREMIEQVKTALKERAAARASNGDILTKANLWLENIYMIQAAFFVPDIEEFGRTVMETFDRSRVKQGNSILGIIGLILLAVGGIGLVIFSFKFIGASFQQGFGWGLLIFSNGLAGYMIRFGEPAVLASHILSLMTTYFVITRFQAIRKPILFCLVCLDLVLAALVIIRIGLTGA